MRWQSGRRSANVEDRRGRRGVVLAGSGIAGVLALLAALFFGVDPGAVLEGGEVEPAQSEEQAELADFASVVLADTEDVWSAQLAGRGGYREPTLVLYDGYTQTACGGGSAAVGPFYCPLDEKVYLDLSFFRELERQLDAPGDFARAYVIAHEIGHHVQTLLGISEDVARASDRSSATQANRLSVQQELQADCLAGVWAHHAQRERQILEPGDIDEALGAASAIGDDTLQRRSQGYVVPDSFTHGTSAERSAWFRRGFEQGELGACDTFTLASR